MSIRGDFVPSNDESNGHALRNSFSALSSQMGDDDGGWMPIVEEHTSATGTPMKLVPLLQLYGTTSGGTNGNGLRNTKVVGSRKGKARKLDVASMAKSKEPLPNKPLLIYTRRNKNAHKNDVSKPGLSFHERLLNRAKLLATGRQTVEPNHVPESRTFVTSPVEREVKRTTELEYGIVKVEVSVGNGESIHDYDKGSVDNPVVHYKGIEGGGVLQGSGVSMSVESSALGLNIVITPDSDDHDGIEKLKKEILGQSANGSIFAVGSRDDNDQMKKKSQKKRKFEGIDLLPEKRLKGNDYDGTWLRESRARKQRAARLGLNWNSQTVNQTGSSPSSTQISEPPKGGYSTASSKKKWIEVGLNGVEPEALLGYKCRVYWPMDDDWYSGVIDKYNSEKNQHHVQYADGEEEWLLLTEEKIKLFLSREEMIDLNLEDRDQAMISEMKKSDYDEMAALAASLDDYQGEPGHGDLIWAKITGHSMWPAFVMDEAHAKSCVGLEPATREGSIPVQFFGSYDYARINSKQAIPFSRGFQSNFQFKCKRMPFVRGLDEAWRYLKERKLPEEMANLHIDVVKSGCQIDNEKELELSDADEDCMGDERSEKVKKSVECLFSCPIVIAGLRVLSLGKIVKDSEHFHDEHHIWTEGYTVIRKFSSVKVPGTSAEYKMEVLRNPLARSMPLFRVTLEDGEQIDGSTPTECWKKIYIKLEKAKQKPGNGFKSHVERKRYYSGSYMFGFSNQRIAQLIQALPNSRACSKYTDWIDKSAAGELEEVLPAGYRPVQVQWKDLDRCSVCHMEEEYVNNLFLQCDNCRMMVHANCYGELEPLDGQLWLCNLCRPGAPRKWPPCCLCPITGGAMKRTTDGRWAHLTCATWIPETCLVDIKRMEPIDGINRISKDRWKLLCSICEVPYGACIQCSDHNCRVAYHPLCARAAGLCVEVQEEKKVRHAGSVDEECEQHLRLLSFCKKHRQPTEERSPVDQQRHLTLRDCSSYIPPSNPSGCARCEPYNLSGRRGRKEPEALVAASSKRLFVENRPYFVSGCRKNGPWAEVQVNAEAVMEGSCVRGSYLPVLESARQYSTKPQSEVSLSSMSDKYEHMRATFRKRLAFGKSGIHGFGIFAKVAHKAGDMVIEYTGEIVRPIIADIREHFIYNSLVGAGTYMFRIDEERVLDATRAGSIAHLINHSCEPNCYSRVINVGGEDRIIIFAKRDIKQWEELTYDYRFFSIDEQLACYCGFPRCRGIVNVNDAEEQIGKICVPCRELIDWTPDDVK